MNGGQNLRVVSPPPSFLLMVNSLELLFSNNVRAELLDRNTILLPYLSDESHDNALVSGRAKVIRIFDTKDELAFILSIAIFSHEYLHKLIWEMFDRYTTVLFDDVSYLTHDSLEIGM